MPGWRRRAGWPRTGRNDRIVLLEAHEVGENASARNSGFAIDLPHNVGSSLAELEGSHRFMRLSRAAIDYLDRAVKAAGIDCQWSRRGKYHTAVSEQGRRRVLEPFARELDALGEPYRWLDAAALRKEIGTPYYHAAVYTPGCMLMNPAALTRGLAGSLPENVTLYEHSPVVRIAHDNGVRLETAQGSLYAPKLILCTNGFAETFGYFQRQLLVFAAFASLSAAADPRGMRGPRRRGRLGRDAGQCLRRLHHALHARPPHPDPPAYRLPAGLPRRPGPLRRRCAAITSAPSAPAFPCSPR